MGIPKKINYRCLEKFRSITLALDTLSQIR